MVASISEIVYLVVVKMSDSVKVEKNVCLACEDSPNQDQVVKCYACKMVFHAYCESNTDNNFGTKTMVKTFVAASTKGNFKFFCDPCLTKMEMDEAEAGTSQMKGLEDKVNIMEKKLDTITKLLEKTQNIQTNNVAKPLIKNIWDDKDKLESVKAPLQKAVLVIKGSEDQVQNDANRNKIGKTIIENSIPVNMSYQKRSGDIVVHCDSVEKRNELKNKVESTNIDMVMETPVEKRASITIVGLREEYDKDEIIKMLVLQNGFIKGFSNANEIKNHIEIYAVRPLKNNPNRFQAFATVSKTLRGGLQHFGDKVTLGMIRCKIYDRFHIKRCNNCQKFGHYMRDCPTPDSTVCGKCSSFHHSTKECQAHEAECINCIRNGIEEKNHHTNSMDCKTLQREILRKKNRNHLNFPGKRHVPPW